MTGKWRETIYGRIAIDFSMTTLRDLCDTEARIQTGPFGSQLHQKDYVTIGTPIITVEHIGENHIIHDDLPYVSNRDLDRLSRYKLQCGDIVFSRVGSVDRRALVRSSENGWLFSGRCLRIRPNPEQIDSSYLSYFFGLPTFKEYIRLIAVGATMPSLNTSLLSDVLVPHPRDICEQRAIAHILGTLDDKIELNRKMNTTLEEMARAIFKSWFVNFEPVRAKMDGRWQHGQSLPGLPASLFDLCPDKLVGSELGVIPEGWVLKRYIDTIVIFGGGTPNTSIAEYWNGDIPWFSVVDAPTNSDIWVIDTAKKISVKGLTNSSTKILPTGTTIISARGTVGKVALVARPMAMNQSCYAFRSKIGDKGFYTYFCTRDLVARLQQCAHGSVFDTITRDTIASVLSISPPDNFVKSFDDYIEPFILKIRENLFHSRTLAALRDTLLPKLISGQIRVKDAERFLKQRGL